MTLTSVNTYKSNTFSLLVCRILCCIFSVYKRVALRAQSRLISIMAVPLREISSLVDVQLTFVIQIIYYQHLIRQPVHPRVPEHQTGIATYALIVVYLLAEWLTAPSSEIPECVFGASKYAH